MNKYDDIINLNRPVSNHPKLGIDSRASQFSPFSALTGYDDEVKETARLTDKKIDIDDGLKELLNAKLNYLQEHIKENNKVCITYFVRDNKKNGGEYKEKTGIIKKIEPVYGYIKFKDNEVIYMSDILSINSNVFDKYE